MTGAYLLLANGSTGPVPPPAPRSPLVLPPCHSCPSPYSYDQDLSRIWAGGQPPRDRRFLRMNAWGIPIPGLPFVPGITSSRHPERFLSYLWGLYPDADQQQWILEVLRRGYTHGLFSWPNWRTQVGRPLSAFAAEIARAKAAGLPAAIVMLGAKPPMDPPNRLPSQWLADVQPVFDALAGIADEYSVWEYDLWNLDGSAAIDIHSALGDQAHAQGADFYAHFSSHVAHWDPLGRFHFWNSLGSHVDGLNYQGEPAWDIGELQARSVDILNQFAGTGHRFRQFEPGTPSLMFDGDHPTEDEADAFGYLSICTAAAAPVWGFGAGGRHRDGTVL